MTDVPPSTHADVLRDTCRSVSELIASAHGPLRRMHVRVADVTVEVEWPESSSAPTTSAPAYPGVLAAVEQPAESGDPATHHLCASGVGTYYRAPEPGAPPFVDAGDRVEAGQQIGILECMKLMIPIEADRAGLVAEIVADNGQAVEFGQPLIRVEG